MSNILFVTLSLVLGWVALAPARRYLDAIAFHALSVPVGLLAWLGPALLFLALGRPWSLPFALLAAAAAALLMAAAFALAAQHSGGGGSAAPLWTYPAAALGVAGVAWWQVFRGVTIVGFDSYGHWEASGIWLVEVGKLEPWLMSGRSLLIPSWTAAEHVLGGSWAGAVFPLLAVVLLVLLARTLWRGPLARLPLAIRVGLTLLVPGLLVLTPPFKYHAFLVHTHMAAAVYLLGSIACLVAEPAAEGSVRLPSAPLLALSGLLAAGFALTRPDTPAYLLLPMGAFAALWLTEPRPRRAAPFWLPLLAPLWAAYGLALLKLGFWTSTEKLTGAVALLVVGGLSAAPLVVAALRRIPAVRALKRPVDLVRAVAAVEALGLLAVLFVKRGDVPAAAGNMLTNMFSAGAQGSAWYFVAGTLIVAMLFPAVRKRAVAGEMLLFTIFQFFVVALVIHGTSHVGRLGLNDSFNRVSFHILPFAFWYFGALAGAAAEVVALSGTRPARARRDTAVRVPVEAEEA